MGRLRHQLGLTPRWKGPEALSWADSAQTRREALGEALSLGLHLWPHPLGCSMGVREEGGIPLDDPRAMEHLGNCTLLYEGTWQLQVDLHLEHHVSGSVVEIYLDRPVVGDGPEVEIHLDTLLRRRVGVREVWLEPGRVRVEGEDRVPMPWLVAGVRRELHTWALHGAVPCRRRRA